MVVIDAHCHLSRNGGPAAKLIEHMDAAGVDKAFVFSDNAFVAEAVGQFPGRFVPFVYFDPRYEEAHLEEIDRYVEEHGWRGVKVGHQSAVARWMYPMMEKAQELGLVVIIHSDHSVRSHPYVIGDIASSFPKVKTVILHMGGGTSFDSELTSIKTAEKNPNVLLETSYSNPYAIRRAVRALGAERVMFGSDCSNDGYARQFERPGQYLEIMLDAVRVIGLPREDEEMVLGGSAARLMGVEAG